MRIIVVFLVSEPSPLRMNQLRRNVSASYWHLLFSLWVRPALSKVTLRIAWERLAFPLISLMQSAPFIIFLFVRAQVIFELISKLNFFWRFRIFLNPIMFLLTFSLVPPLFTPLFVFGWFFAVAFILITIYGMKMVSTDLLEIVEIFRIYLLSFLCHDFYLILCFFLAYLTFSLYSFLTLFLRSRVIIFSINWLLWRSCLDCFFWNTLLRYLISEIRMNQNSNLIYCYYWADMRWDGLNTNILRRRSSAEGSILLIGRSMNFLCFCFPARS